MAKGAEAKKEVFNILLNTLKGSFMYNGDKELRYNTMENGELVQLKITLTAAKEPVGDINESAFDNTPTTQASASAAAPVVNAEPVNIEVTEEEKNNLTKMMEALGINVV